MMRKTILITFLAIMLGNIIQTLPNKQIEDGRGVSVSEHKEKLPQIARVELASYKKVPVSCLDAIYAVFPADKQSMAIAIAKAESGLINDRVGAVNFDGSVDYGCFQINNKAHREWFIDHDWTNPVQNAKFALQLSYNGTNWNAWSAYKNGSYLRTL